MFSLNFIIPKRAGNSDSEDHHIVEKEVEKEPNENPKECENTLSCGGLIVLAFIIHDNKDATKWENPKEGEENICNNFQNGCNEDSEFFSKKLWGDSDENDTKIDLFSKAI